MILSQYPQVRVWLYTASAALNAIGLVLVVIAPDIGAGILAAGASLGIAANATAANNVTPTTKANGS